MIHKNNMANVGRLIDWNKYFANAKEILSALYIMLMPNVGNWFT